MKIVEFGDDGRPKLLKEGSSKPIVEAAADCKGVRIREFASTASPQPSVDAGKIKIREFGTGDNAAPVQKSSIPKAGPFGAARAPQSIKIVDFDKEKAIAPAKPIPPTGRPHGMKIVEMD